MTTLYETNKLIDEIISLDAIFLSIKFLQHLKELLKNLNCEEQIKYFEVFSYKAGVIMTTSLRHITSPISVKHKWFISQWCDWRIEFLMKFHIRIWEILSVVNKNRLFIQQSLMIVDLQRTLCVPMWSIRCLCRFMVGSKKFMGF